VTLPDPPRDPQELTGLPYIRWDVAQPLYRLHDALHAPQWFATDPDTTRFAPPPAAIVAGDAPYGVCSLATHPVGAFLETLGRVNPILQSAVDTKAMSTCHLPSDVRLADQTDNRWRAAFPRLTAAIGVGADYLPAQRWGQRIFQAGFAGIFYPAAHDLALVHRSVALFGKPRLDEAAFSSSPDADSEEVLDYIASLGWVVLPAAPLPY